MPCAGCQRRKEKLLRLKEKLKGKVLRTFKPETKVAPKRKS